MTCCTSGAISPGNPVYFSVQASPLAAAVTNYPILVTATDQANNSSVVTLPVNISVPFPQISGLSRSTFADTSQSVTGVAYDPVRKQVFASVKVLNEVVVLSAADGHRIATIPVQRPDGIDVSADGSAVYVVSSELNGVVTIDPNLLEVVATSKGPSTTTFFQVAALANGKVFLNPYAGSFQNSSFLLWDPASDTYVGTGSRTLSENGTLLIARSADHSRVIAYAPSNSTLYDAESNSFTGLQSVGGTKCALNPNGSQILCGNIQGAPTAFYNDKFEALATLPSAAVQVDAVLYSLDGSRAYMVSDGSGAQPITTAFDTNSFAPTGNVPSPDISTKPLYSGDWLSGAAIDETGMIFGPASIGVTNGVAFVDASSPGTIKLPIFNSFTIAPSAARLSGTTAAQISAVSFQRDAGSSYQVFVGAAPASPNSLKASGVSVVSDNYLDFTIPAGNAPGPANVTIVRDDGYTQIEPNGVTFGPAIYTVDPNGGSTAGGDQIKIYGLGFDASGVSVEIGGKTASVVSNTAVDGIPALLVTTPAGAAGSADVTVTTAAGSTTMTGGYTYAQTDSYALAGVLADVIYDKWRQRLYVSNFDHNRIEVFDVKNRNFLSPIPVGTGPEAIALTTDGTELAVFYGSDSLGVVDLSSLTLKATYPVLTNADNCTPAVPAGITNATGHRMLVLSQCTSISDGGAAHFIDLDTGSLSCAGITGCKTDGVTYPANLGAVASSADGTKIIFGSPCDNPGGPVLSVLDLTANVKSTGAFSPCVVAASNDGQRFAGDFGVTDDLADLVSFTAWERYANAGSIAQNNTFAEQLSPSGALLFAPQVAMHGDPQVPAVGIFDTHTGRLRQRVELPQDLGGVWSALALDDTGSAMFTISTTGIMVTQLSNIPLAVATVTPASGPAGTTLTLRGSGFQAGATVSFGSVQAATTFVDANTLSVIVPTGAPGAERITVKNPAGNQYSYDVAFTMN